MAQALELAREAGEAGEIPVGCVIIGPDGAVVGRGRNRREEAHSALAHAEVEAIASACRTLGTWRLEGCTLYVTLEPCPMCAGAILNARISEVYYGAAEGQTGSCGTVVDLFTGDLGYQPKVYGGLLEEESRGLLGGFFKGIRRFH